MTGEVQGRPIRWRAVLAAGGSVVAVTLVLSWLGFGWISASLAAGARAKAAAMARLAADAAANPVVSLDVARLREVMAVARLGAGVVDAVAFDAAGRILTDGTVENPRRHHRFPGAAETLRGGEVRLTSLGGGLVRVTAPVRVGEAVVGGVALDVSLAPLARERERLAIRVGALGLALALVLGGLAAWLAQRSVARPVEELTRAAEAVTAGRPARLVADRAPREVRALARALETMLRRLQNATLSRETLERTLDALGEGLVVVDPEGRVESANAGLVELCGGGAAAIVGRSFEELFVPDDREAVRGWLRAARDEERGVVHGEARLDTERGSVPVLATLRAMHRVVGGGLDVVCLLRDARDLARQRERQDRFLATVTHELRTPVTAIAGAVGLLDDELASRLEPGHVDLLRIAAANCERLARLVDDLLDLERVRLGLLEIAVASVPLPEVVADEVGRMRPYAAGRGVRLELGEMPPVAVRADRRRLGQVLGNLLSNACKFSPRGTAVEVRARAEGGRVRVEVADRGPGVPPRLRPHLFERFASGDAPARGAGGAGLGLSIARELAERMGASVGYRDRDGGGAVFWVELEVAG